MEQRWRAEVLACSSDFRTILPRVAITWGWVEAQSWNLQLRKISGFYLLCSVPDHSQLPYRRLCLVYIPFSRMWKTSHNEVPPTMSSSSSTIVSTILSEGGCTFDSLTLQNEPSRLLSLPSELRSTIWELALSADDSRNEYGEVNLITANFPSRALLLTCRKVYNEVHKIYEQAYHIYWTNTQFYLNSDDVAVLTRTSRS